MTGWKAKGRRVYAIIWWLSLIAPRQLGHGALRSLAEVQLRQHHEAPREPSSSGIMDIAEIVERSHDAATKIVSPANTTNTVTRPLSIVPLQGSCQAKLDAIAGAPRGQNGQVSVLP